MKLNNPLMAREEAALRWRLALGGYLKELRLSRGMTQEEVCAAVGFENKQMISAMENGRTSVPTERLVELANAFKVPTEEFAKTVLRYQDPWSFAALYGADAQLRRELASVSTRARKWRGPMVVQTD